MIYNTLFGFILPWFGGYFLYKKDKYLVVIVAPIAALISHTINALGIQLNLWHYQPFDLGAFATLPLNLGYFAVAGCLIVYLIQRLRLNPYLLLFLASLILTFFEFLAISGGLLIYSNGWNYIYTIISYYVAYTLVYFYQRHLNKLIVLKKGCTD